MVTLHYTPPTGADEPYYHDEQNAHIYWEGEHDVPPNLVSEYLDEPGWSRTQNDSQPLDIENLLDNDYRYVVETIESGDVDDDLEDIRAKEKNRAEGSGPRPSVLEAVKKRLDMVVAARSASTEDDA